MKKCRIVERTLRNGEKIFVIQQRHFLFRWWCDAWINLINGAIYLASFDTIEDAKKNLCYFDGTKVVDNIVYEV